MRPTRSRASTWWYSLVGFSPITSATCFVVRSWQKACSRRIRRGSASTLIWFSIGVVGTLLLPAWAALGALAALVTNCSIVVERAEDED